MQTKNNLIIKTLILLSLCIGLYADAKQEMLNLYKNEKYEEACKLGFKNFSSYRKNESFVSLYAFSCLYSDYIDRLSIPIATLKFTPEGRANSAYFSVILMQKKLLYHALIDGYDITSLNLPTTDYIFSKVFDLYVALGEHKQRKTYVFNDKEDKNTAYKLYVLKDERLSKIVVEEFYNNISIKQHIYW